MPERVQLSRRRGYRKPEGTVVVTRASRYGNPFRILGKPGRGGSVCGPPWSRAVEEWGRPSARTEYALYVSCSRYADAVAHSVSTFRTLMEVRKRDDPERFEKYIAPLRGQNVGCFCALDHPCHGDVLMEFANTEGETDD